MFEHWIKKCKFDCYKVIPLVFDNSLSYYETLCSFNAKLCEIIDVVNRQNIGFCEFANMVNEAFETYKVEINTVLNNFSGDFEEFKQEVLDIIAHISTGVGEWIEPGTEYTVEGDTYTAGIKCEIFNSYEGEVRNKAAGNYSHAEGANTAALATADHAEGTMTIASGGGGSHAEGAGTKATAQAAHAEGTMTIASGGGSHAENADNTASGDCSHAEGYKTNATSFWSHSEGELTTASGKGSHAEGYQTVSSGEYAHAEGYNSIASGLYAHAENGAKAAGDYSHAEGWNGGDSYGAIGSYSHVEGYGNICVAEKSHIEGNANKIQDNLSTFSHLEGQNNTCSNSQAAHLEGDSNYILGGSNRSHVEGYDNYITDYTGVQNSGSFESHAEGEGNRIESSQRSHVEGYHNVINRGAYNSHAEGESNTISANAENSHVHGYGNTAGAGRATATGYETSATGQQSTTMGTGTIASGDDSLAIGKYNVDSGAGYSLIIGDGADSANRSNVIAVDNSNHIIEFASDIQFKLGNGTPFTPGSGGSGPAIITGSITPYTSDYKFDESGLESSATQYGNVCVLNIQCYLQSQVSIPATYRYLHIGDFANIALPTKKIFVPAVIITSTTAAGSTQAAFEIDTTGKIQLFTVANSAWTVAVQTGIFATITYTV